MQKNKDLSVDYSDIEEVIEKNTGLIHFIIKKHFPWVLGTVNYDDAMQEGKIGLMKAAERFNTDLDVTFSTYAYTVIYREISKNTRSVTTPLEMPRQAYKTYGECKTLQDTGLELNEIAIALGKKESTLRGILNAYNASSLDSIVFDDGGNEVSLMDCIEAPTEDESYILELKTCRELLQLLPPKFNAIFTLHLKGLSQVEISKKLKLSQSYISRILRDCKKNYFSLFRKYLLGEMAYGELILEVSSLYKGSSTATLYVRLRCYIDYALELCSRGHKISDYLPPLIRVMDLSKIIVEKEINEKNFGTFKRLIGIIDSYCMSEGVEVLVNEMVGAYPEGWLDWISSGIA